MKQVQQSQAFLRKRKMMMVLPLLVIPFLTLAFWAMGGGKGGGNAKPSGNIQGLNLNLPNANLKEDKLQDKLSFYDKADKDSLKLAEEMRNDPYYSRKDSTEDNLIGEGGQLEQITQSTASKFNQRLNTSPYETSKNNPEQKIMQKLAFLQKEMNKPTTEKYNDPAADNRTVKNDEFSGEVDRLENMMQVMDKGKEGNPEMEQLEKTLDKILDIQHPQRVKDRIKEKSLKNKEVAFAVSKESGEESISLLDATRKKGVSGTGFYGLSDDTAIAEDQNAIEAVVHENQTLVNGAVIKLRLLNDIYINGSLIPKDNFVFGITTLNNERLEIEINSIRNNNSLFPVKLEVYDMDGLAGIYIPGAITRDVAKQSADNSLQMMEMTSLDPSLAAQATTAGINAAKTLLSKKVKLIKVTVKAGYKILLRDKNAG